VFTSAVHFLLCVCVCVCVHGDLCFINRVAVPSNLWAIMIWYLWRQYISSEILGIALVFYGTGNFVLSLFSLLKVKKKKKKKRILRFMCLFLLFCCFFRVFCSAWEKIGNNSLDLFLSLFPRKYPWDSLACYPTGSPDPASGL
jgi:hypothetical protein